MKKLLLTFLVAILGFFILTSRSQQNIFSVPTIHYLITNVNPLLQRDLVKVVEGGTNWVAGMYQSITPVPFTNDTTFRDAQETNYAWQLVEEQGLFPINSIENASDTAIDLAATNTILVFIQDTNTKVWRNYKAGTINNGGFIEATQGDDSPDVSTVPWLSLNYTSAVVVTNFDLSGIFTNLGLNRELRVKHVNANATISNQVNIQLQGSTNYPGAAGTMQTFINDAGVWREVSRIVL